MLSRKLFIPICFKNCATIKAQLEREEKGNTFTIMNSFWFIAASLLGQGVDVLPRYSTYRI
jgi:hypothetical protein